MQLFSIGLHDLNPDGTEKKDAQSIGGGILIPTTSLEQMFAPVARWFGVSDSNLSTVFPNVGHFDITSLGGLLKQTTKQT
jgi:hypothetical protein